MYTGSDVLVPLGKGGLRSDDAQDDIPLTDLISAKNISTQRGVVEKEPGSIRWNATALPSPVVAFYDFWPNSVTQRVIVVCKNGRVYKFTDSYNYVEITPSGAAPTTLNVSNQAHICEGGQESASANKKIFIFTGNSPVQVISGDASVRTNLSMPAADWSGSTHPTFGIVHRTRLFAFGNRNYPHQVYASSSTNHEDFQTGGSILTYSVYPGDQDGCLGAFIFKTRFFLFKYPRGVYSLIEPDGNLSSSYFTKLNDSFGAASAHSAVPYKDNAYVANNTNSITDVEAAFQLGDIESADLLSALRCEGFVRENVSNQGADNRWGIYYEDKKQVYFSYRSAGGTKNDRLLIIDVSGQTPKVTLSDKDQPSCLALIRDVGGIPRPAYGSEDGYLYLMDREDRLGHRIPAPAACVSALSGSGAGNLTNGVYSYKVTFYSNLGETEAGTVSNSTTVVDATTNGKISITNIPVDITGKSVGRKLYRTVAGGSTYKLLTTFNENSTTIYTDNIADGSLGADAPTVNTTDIYRGEFQTPHNNLWTDQNKCFEFLELTYEATGNWNTTVEIWIDGVLKETKTYHMHWGEPLDEFVLDSSRLSGRVPRTIRKPIHGFGRRISFKIYQSGQGQWFKIPSLRLYYKLDSQAQKATNQ